MIKNQSFGDSGKSKNRLLSEKSPYLSQHACQPVDWYPWSEEAFNRAKKENKPVFLSIGYSTCHWCHVMAHESFENRVVARFINETFVPVKVDREERPDIDKIFMQVALIMIGSGGWPLTIFLTPDKKPFFAATYIPKEDQFGQKGLQKIVLQVKDLWNTRQDAIEQQANQLLNLLRKNNTTTKGDILSQEISDEAFQQFLAQFDREYGGFGKAPKFPSPHQLLFLFKYWKRTRHEQALLMAEKSLQSMRAGGIFDQIGFGFHRYSTDTAWILPHFEKMLYDQALLVMAYLEAFQITGKFVYQKTARQVMDYVIRDMSSPEGGFYSAEDADSEGEEGKFYLWTEEELKRILNEKEFCYIQKYFNIKKEGNIPGKGKPEEFFIKQNIFYRYDILKSLAVSSNGQWQSIERHWDKIRKKLFILREKRLHPGKDDKILTDWNSLMIAALAKAGHILEEKEYIRMASRAADFIFNKMIIDRHCLYHRYRDEDANIMGFLDDYAFLIWGLLELHKATSQSTYLQKALVLNNKLMEDFWDRENGGFYFTSASAEILPIRMKEVYDGAIPSGNSVALSNLLKLARLTGDLKFFNHATKIEKAFSPLIQKNPTAYAFFLAGIDSLER